MKTAEFLYEESQGLMKKAVWRRGQITEMKARISNLEFIKTRCKEEWAKKEVEDKIVVAVKNLEQCRSALKKSLEILKDYLCENL